MEFRASVNSGRARLSSMRDMEIESVQSWTPRLPLLDPKRKYAIKDNRKVLWSSRRSLRCSRSDQRSLLPLIRRHSSSSPTMNPKADNRSIDFRPRLIRRDVYVRGELRQSSSTAHHNFRLARSIPPKTTSSSRITLFSRRFFLHFFFLLFLVSPSTSLFVVVLALFYFSSYSRVQFCVLLPPVTLAENNNNICSPPLDKGRQ